MTDEAPTPLGPNDMPVREHIQEWPSWRTGPNGERQIFNSPEEVPDGWTDTLPTATTGIKLPERREPARTLLDQKREEGDRQEAIEKLVDEKSHKELVEILEMMNLEREDSGEEEIEFLPSWPKLKLATAIVDNAKGEEDGEEGGEEGEGEGSDDEADAETEDGE